MSGLIRRLRDNRDESRFEAILADGSVATRPYEVRADTIALHHTSVPAHYAGRGIADRLNRFARREADRRKLTIKAGCPFIED